MPSLDNLSRRDLQVILQYSNGLRARGRAATCHICGPVGLPWALRGTIRLCSSAEDTEGCVSLGTLQHRTAYPASAEGCYMVWRKKNLRFWRGKQLNCLPIPKARQRAHGCWFGTASVAEGLLTRLTGNAHFCSFLCCFEALA